MIKHGSKMIQAVTNATVPQITLYCGASYRRGQLRHVRTRLSARASASPGPMRSTAVMGGEQAAETMAIVTRAAAAARKRQAHADEDQTSARSRIKHRHPVRQSDGRVRDLRPAAGRWRDRPSRHPRCAGMDVHSPSAATPSGASPFRRCSFRWRGHELSPERSQADAFPHHPDRQSRRDRSPHHGGPRKPHGLCHGRRLFRPPTRRRVHVRMKPTGPCCIGGSRPAAVLS